ncbi:MAG: AraC family transcriptional regulator [Pigmentiphaga sp.]
MTGLFSGESIVDWLINSLRLEATVFHAGRYCGAWQASTAGRLLGSFHLVLDGHCWLHRPGHPSLALGPRDSVFFLQDVPHRLSSEPEGAAQPPTAPMLPLSAPAERSATGLACGFFQFGGSMVQLLLESLPECIVIRADEAGGEQVNVLFQLIRQEAGDTPDHPPPLLARLVEVLFFYAIRHATRQGGPQALGVWGLAHHPRMAGLLTDILSQPGEPWTVALMARHVHMSRTNFCRHFIELTGQPPAAFLASLRMSIAARRLEHGDTIELVADYVGYRSSAAFSRAFKKIIGEQPGAWRRASRDVGPRPLMQ